VRDRLGERDLKKVVYKSQIITEIELIAIIPNCDDYMYIEYK